MTTETLDIKALEGLSPENLGIIQALIQQMAGRGKEENVRRRSKPIDGMPQWEAKLRQERYSPKTIKMYVYYAGRYLEGNPTPTRLDIQLHLAHKLENGTSPAAVENMRKALRSLFRFLHDEALWHEDPTERIRKVKVTYSSRPCPTLEEIQRVVDKGCRRQRDTDKLRTIIRLLSTTGLRLSECAGLRKDNIDWDMLELRIMGKGGKFRVVPLLPSTAKLIRGYQERNPSPSPFVFPGDTKTGHADIHNIEKTFKRACIRAGVRLFSPHGLRHFYATEMLKAGAKLEVVGRILGHSSIGITADIYRHVRTGEMHEEHLRFAPLNS